MPNIETTVRRGLSPRNTTLMLLGVLALGFALRFVFFYQMATSPIAEMVIEDSKTYNDWAQQIARGNWRGDEVFYALPLYAYFLGLVYAIFGYHLQLARFIQVLLGTLNCYLLFRLGRDWFGPAVALLSAGLMAIYGWLIVYDSAILSPVLIIFFNLILLRYLYHLKEPGRGWPWFALGGLLLGVTATVSAPALLFLPAGIVWIFIDFPALPGGRRLTRAISFTAGFILIIGLVTFRNWKVGGDPVVLTAHGGINFFIGNNPHSRGVFEPPPILRSGGATLRDDSVKIAEKALGRRLTPSEVSGYWFGQGLSFIRTQPLRYLKLLIAKFTVFWDGLEIADVIHPYFFQDFAPVLKIPLLVFPIVSPLALLGLGLSLRLRRRLSLLYLFVGSYLLSNILYFINSRYRLPLVPLFLLFAAYTFIWWWECLRQRRFHFVLLSFIPLIILVLFTNPGIAFRPRFVLNLGAGYNHLGTFYSQKGDLQGARREFERALKLEPYRAEAHYNLANIHLKLKNYDAAVRGYQEAIRINPFYESARLALGLAYEQKGENDRAKREYLEIIQNLPRNPPAYLRLAQMLISEGKPDDAIPVLQRLLAIQPGVPGAYLFLALAYQKKGDIGSARAALEKGVELAPDEGKLRLELGRLLCQPGGDLEKASVHLGAAARLLPDNYFARLYFGDCLHQCGREQEAVVEWKAARALRPGEGGAEERLRAVSEGIQ